MAAMRRAGEVEGGGGEPPRARAWVPEVSSTILISFIDNSRVSTSSLLVNLCFLFPPELRIEGAALTRETNGLQLLLFFFFFSLFRRRRLRNYQDREEERRSNELNYNVEFNLFFFFLIWNIRRLLKFYQLQKFINDVVRHETLLKFWERNEGGRASRGFPRMHG